MCMEDIRIGRQTYSDSKVITVNNLTAVPLLPADVNRTYIVIPSTSFGAYYIGINDAVTVNSGFEIRQNNSPIILKIADVGNLVTRQLFAISAAGTFSFLLFFGGLSKR